MDVCAASKNKHGKMMMVLLFDPRLTSDELMPLAEPNTFEVSVSTIFQPPFYWPWDAAYSLGATVLLLLLLFRSLRCLSQTCSW